MSVILYYYDAYDVEKKVVLSEYSLTDAQALVNLALERHQPLRLQLTKSAQLEIPLQAVTRVILVEESFAKEILDRVDAADEAMDHLDEDEDDESDADPEC